ncbi:hypothetical protein SDC9_193103 [bioreactor metagenome]|uniref:Uncharacterized protein n=1 Tax=bioreactor metagenome TaxID=1076179 RepID=A0A645I3T7_9ZZZZ
MAHHYSEAAHKTENNNLNQENRRIGSGNRGQLVVAEKAHHKGVHETQRRGDEVLQDHGKRQLPQPTVKAGLLAKDGKHSYLNYSLLI